LTVEAAVVLGNPAANAAARTRYAAFPSLTYVTLSGKFRDGGLPPDLTFPQQISSTICGSILDFSMTLDNSEYTKKSSCVSLNPPLKPFASGVRIASVITTSSAFLEVLSDYS
jgi:hypothetical protein